MASQRDLAKQLLQRTGDDEAAAKAMLPIEAVTSVRRQAWVRDQTRLVASPAVREGQLEHRAYLSLCAVKSVVDYHRSDSHAVASWCI
jgi:hypothetical protein